MTDARDLLSPEARLSLLLDREQQEDLAEVRRLLDRELDWRKILELVDRELSALPVWRTLRRSGLEPSFDEAKVLKRMAEIWEFKLIHLQRLLFQTLEAFESAGFEPILLKGAATALTVREDVSRRPMLDVDLLLPEEEAEAAWVLARELEWNWDSARFPRDAYGDAHHLPPLHDDFGSGVGLEIHTTISMPDHPFGLDAGGIRSRADEIRVDGRSLSVPTTNDQLLHCCIHFAWSHRMASHAWRAFSDVHALITSKRIDWKSFVREARESKADTCCYWTLSLARRVAGVPVPRSVLEELEPARSRFVLERLERHFILNLLPDGRECPSQAVQRRIWQMGIRRGRGSKGIHLTPQPEPATMRRRMRSHFGRIDLWFRYLAGLV